MSHEVGTDAELLSRLHSLDLELLDEVRRRGCHRCGGRLDRADFPRKVRGIPAWAESLFEVRFALCCSVEDCRRRTLPPSTRFLGRKVYAAVAIVVACIAESTHRRWQEVRRIARWLLWWREVFGQSELFVALRGRLAVPVAPASLPGALFEAIVAPTVGEQMRRFLLLVAGAASPPSHAS